ncbi:hypothetical protein [Oscillospiraceae bacterium]|nr:hypothetical protein [Oscillospiraceae bacterium]
MLQKRKEILSEITFHFPLCLWYNTYILVGLIPNPHSWQPDNKKGG